MLTLLQNRAKLMLGYKQQIAVRYKAKLTMAAKLCTEKGSVTVVATSTERASFECVRDRSIGSACIFKLL